MAEYSDFNNRIQQNLADAGCPEEFTKLCIKTVKDRNLSGLVLILSEYRKELLEIIHDQQRNLDRLDYLIYSINSGEFSEV